MLSKIEKLVACVCVSIMAVLVFVNVIARYVFGNSLAVSDEMSTYLFVLMSFMGTAVRRIWACLSSPTMSAPAHA